jgi:uncharacterized protein (DUF2237 family)
MNVLGGKLQPCSFFPTTGWLRNGFCAIDQLDSGLHVVCAKVTRNFLNFTKSKGNDLITPRKNFPGLKEGDFWCLCAARWLEAYRAGVAPPVLLESTNIEVAKIIPLNILIKFKI